MINIGDVIAIVLASLGIAGSVAVILELISTIRNK